MAEIPEHILRRSAEARAKAEGRDVDEVLAEMKGEPTAPSAPAPAADTSPPTATPEPAAPAASAAPPPAATNGGTSRDLAAESAQFGVPVNLLRRGALARAKAEGSAPPMFAGEGAGPKRGRD